MTTYNTGNPIGSAAAQDLYDNAQNLDHLSADRVNETWPDRFGIPRLTWYGMEERIKQAIINLGWNPVGTFQEGATLNTGSIIQDETTRIWYRWDDLTTLPKIVPPGSTPGSTGGIGEGKWLAVDVSDVLRKQISDPDGATKYPELQIARWRDEGDLRGWGCVCDGVADDSDNLQAAIIYSEIHDRKLYASGPVRITKKITFTKPPQLRGFMYSPPVIGKFQGAPYDKKGFIIYSEVPLDYCVEINPPGNNKYIRGLNLIDIHVLAQGTGVNGKGVLIANCGWGGYVRGLVVEGFHGGGLTLSQLQDTLFDQLEILDCGTDNVVAALEITNGSNLLAFNRARIEANEFQMRIRNSMMIDFIAPHFEQGDYPDASAGAEFEKINRYPSIYLQASQNIKFHGGFIFGATIQKQMAKYGITAADCPFHMSVGGDCSNIDLLGVTMGFGYNSGRILEHHGSGKVQNCTPIALCTETYPIILDGNILFQNNQCGYTDNPTSETFFLMAAKYATIEANMFACVNSSSVNKLYGSLFALNPSNPILLGRNQYVISKRALFHDGTVRAIAQGYDGTEQSSGGAINMQQHNITSVITLFGGAGGAANVTALNNMSPGQRTMFQNNGTGNITFNHGGNIYCNGGVNAVVPSGHFIEFIYNGSGGVSTELSRSF